ncbi:MAG TPA: lactonase family protein [Polyangia bacterium]|nr:lactonase family protein [Polyangia bacterium]
MTSAEPTAATDFVYVGNAGSQDIGIYHLEPNGDLRAIAIFPVGAGTTRGGSLPLAVDAERRLLFAALRTPPYSVATFAIEETTGTLRHLGDGALPASMAYLAVDETGRFLLSASYDASEVVVSPIGTDGVVHRTSQVVPTQPRAHCIVLDRSNRHALATSLGGDAVHQMRFDAETGTLSPNDPPTASVTDKAGPRHLVFSPSGRFVHLVNELDGSIHVYPYDSASGLLKPATQVMTVLPPGFSGTPWAADIHLTPDGRFLYASERTSSTLAGFRVDETIGILTPLGSVATATQPRAFAISPSGRHLLSAGEASNRIAVHSIDHASGRLSLLRDYAAGDQPTWIEIVERSGNQYPRGFL